jgi:hypothetical protein
MSPDRAVICPACRRASSVEERQELGGLCPGCLLELADGPRPVRADAADEPPPLEPGASFRSLEVEALLGRGGMGYVYRARHLGLDRPFALKILSPELASRPGFADRFVREARAMAALDHPRIVRITDSGQERGLSFIVMDYVEGPTLRQRMSEGPIPLPDALGIALDLCDALAAAHARGIVHRDIKPENILFDAAGRAKVTDFGLAKALVRGESVALTRTSAVMGTARYMAPEQLEQLTVDHRADIYSLGAVLYELFAGEVPSGAFPPARRSTVSRRLERIIVECLDPSPEGRPPSALHVRRALERWRRRSSPASNRLRAPALAILLAGTTGALGVAIGVRRGRAPALRDLPGRWEELDGSGHGGGVSNQRGVVRQPALALDRRGHPLVAWVADAGAGADIHVRRWDGGGWVDLGGPDGVSASAAPSRMPAIALDGQDNPVLAWVEDADGVWLQRYRDGRWEGMGGWDQTDLGSAARVEWPGLAVHGDQLAIAWCGDGRVFVRHFEGGDWREHAGSASGDGLSGVMTGECRPSVALDSAGRPWVAWARPGEGQTGDLFVRRWDGGRWEGVGGASVPARARSVRLALTAEDHPVITWRDFEPNARRSWIMARAWDGRAWQELGGSARGRGLVSEGSSAYRPDLALDRRGHPVVVWNALIGPGNEHEIYAKRWDGKSWAELGGSGSGNGLSAAPGDSGGAAIALDAEGRPTVVWTEAGARTAEIYLRRFVPSE